MLANDKESMPANSQNPTLQLRDALLSNASLRSLRLETLPFLRRKQLLRRRQQLVKASDLHLHLHLLDELSLQLEAARLMTGPGSDDQVEHDLFQLVDGASPARMPFQLQEACYEAAEHEPGAKLTLQCHRVQALVAALHRRDGELEALSDVVEEALAGADGLG